MQTTSGSGRAHAPCVGLGCGRQQPARAQSAAERKSRRRMVARAQKKAESVVEKISEFVDECGENIMEFCNLDSAGRPIKKTLGEKESDFLDALRSFYYDKVPILSNEEFDTLKEELQWQGSKVVALSGTEQRFLEAAKSYQAGSPILNDVEYDALKVKLQQKNSIVTSAGPRCSIRSRSMYSDAMPDYPKMTALNLPAAVLTLLVVFGVDDLSGFSITRAVELPNPWGLIAVWGLVLPLAFLVSTALTGLVLKDFLILKGPCPNCNTSNSTFFGDIFNVKGPRTDTTRPCPTCGAKLDFSATKRSITVSAPPPQQPPPGSKVNKENQPQPA